MTKLTQFDVLIVYSERLATSATRATKDSVGPFRLGSKNQNYNTVYSYFLKSCHELGLTAAFTTSADIVGPGFCCSYWEFKDDKWSHHNSPCYSTLIFDKFSPTTVAIKRRRTLLFSQPHIKPFNQPALYNLFFDKLSTFNKLPLHSIPTIFLDRSTSDIQSNIDNLSAQIDKHPYHQDFAIDYVLKDRFGSGGLNIYKITANNTDKISSVLQRHQKVSFILQPFVNFTSTDFRLIYLGGQIVQAYIRQAKSTDFRCNEHSGGLLTYLPLSSIPPKVIAKSNEIAKLLNNQCSLYTLDFIVSHNGHIFFLEGNTGPGLDWNESLPQNEFEAKRLISLVATELCKRTQVATIQHTTRVVV
ncbi:hypothetical protein KBC75_00660 [Candidatus Shapirobacteria bacterium]|nr:hypothetical protein [Candidatus Shapirobacteria bacterium]